MGEPHSGQIAIAQALPLSHVGTGWAEVRNQGSLRIVHYGSAIVGTNQDSVGLYVIVDAGPGYRNEGIAVRALVLVKQAKAMSDLVHYAALAEAGDPDCANDRLASALPADGRLAGCGGSLNNGEVSLAIVGDKLQPRVDVPIVDCRIDRQPVRRAARKIALVDFERHASP